MTEHVTGILRFIDPPADQHLALADAYGKCDYPWTDPPGTCAVRWFDFGQGGTMRYNRYTDTVEVNTNPVAGTPEPFPFVHELGHRADRRDLSNIKRHQLTVLMHTRPLPQIGHYNHDHPDAGHHVEQWNNERWGEPYTSEIAEAWADVFVLTYAPALWPGYARFVHHTTDAAAVRRILSSKDVLTVERIAGADRYETAVLAAYREWPPGSVVPVYIANGTSPVSPDTLVGAALACGKEPGPLLWVPGSGTVPSQVLDYVEQVKPYKVVVLGGVGAVPDAVAAQVEAAAAP